jgi:hypothetical protein
MTELLKGAAAADSINEPMDLVNLSLKEKVFVKCRFGRELRGKLVVSAAFP